MEKEKAELYAENDKVAIYRANDMSDYDVQEKDKPQIFMWARRSEIPFKEVKDTIDYLVSLKDSWETLPELNSDISMKRQELKDWPFNDSDPRKGKAPNDSWTGGFIEYFSHVQPLPYIRNKEHVLNNINWMVL